MGKVVLVNYANEVFKESQKINSETGLLIGGFDEVFSYGPKDIDFEFLQKNKSIFLKEKGNGYWLWKPYFIKKSIEKINFGEYLFYSDSGSYFIGSIKEIIQISIDNNQDVIPFELTFIENEWTKRDAFILMNLDKEGIYDTNQRLGGFSLWRKSEFSIKLIDEWLEYSQDERILTDIENLCNFQNYPLFKEHRHDQSIFSLLTKKYNLIAFRDLTQFGNSIKSSYNNSTYPQLIELTRKRNTALKVRKTNFIKKNINRIVNKIKLLIKLLKINYIKMLVIVIP